MKRRFLTFALFAITPVGWLAAEPETAAETLEQHQAGAAKVAGRQDELAADVQQLTIEQTMPKVIELLNDVEKIMDEATDRLTAHDTGGDTLAAQTEVIEKIHAAAKEKQKQSGKSKDGKGQGEAGGAMMDMLERMMGKKPDGDEKGPGKGKGQGGKGGNEAGDGQKGLSDEVNALVEGEKNAKSEARRVPKSAGTAGQALPAEFQKVLDAYNRGVEKKVK
jgi:hypothetical protein